MKRLTCTLAALVVLMGTCVLSKAEFTGALRVDATPVSGAGNSASNGTPPLAFVPNAGQTDPRVRYSARAAGAVFYFAPGEAVFAFTKGKKGHVLQLTFPGANPSAEPTGARRGTGTVNYLTGGDAARWRTGLPTYGEIVYRDLWPGIDLAFRGEKGELKYEFRVAPGADPENIRLAYRGARRLSLGGDGDLRIHTALGIIHDSRPVSFQEIGGERVAIASRFTLAGNSYGFATGTYDRSRPLVIDPGLDYSTYLGGSGSEQAWDIAVDASGSVYVTGNTFDTQGFPTTAGAFDTTPSPPRPGGTYETFVTKFDPSGAMVYSTYLGTNGHLSPPNGIAVDGSGSAYVVGDTGGAAASEFPTTPGAFDVTPNGNHDAYVIKLNPSGTALEYSTFLGGINDETAVDIAVDAMGSAYITGRTGSPDFPTTPGAFDTSVNGHSDAFVTKLNPAGNALEYSTYLGGSGGGTNGLAIAINASGNAYVTGVTTSLLPITPGAVDPARGGTDEGFVTKLNQTGTALEYSTYLGGEFDDQGNAIAVDSSGSAYVTGSTKSRDFPTTPCALDRTRGGDLDAFVTKLNPAGTALAYSTYLGGATNIPGPSGSVTVTGEIGYGIAVDASGSAVVTGAAASPDFPTTADAFDSTVNAVDVFVTRLSASGGFITYSTFLGGSDNEESRDIALDGRGAVYVTGKTSSHDFPTTPGAFAVSFGGGSHDAFVTKMTLPATVPAEVAAVPTTLQLTPPSAQSPAGTSATLTATVGNTAGNPLQNVVVRFSVTGSRITSGSCTTDADGRCGFSYQGPSFNGSDSISVFVDADNDGLKDTCEPSSTATNTWVGNGPPAVADPGTQTNNEGDAVSLAIVAFDPDGNALTFTAIGLPAGLTIDPATGRISGTIDFTAGGWYDEDGNFLPERAYSVTVMASDGLGSRGVSFGWTVINVNAAPVLATVGDQVVAEGAPLSFTLSASDPDGGQLTFGATELPDGATLDPTTGAFSWTPTYEQAGVYTVTFGVTDSTGRSASETITITVSDVASNLGPVCSAAYPSISEIWPPDHQPRLVSIFGVTDPDNDPLTIIVRRIVQDEPTNTHGDGNTWIDGGGLGASQAWVRAERSGANRVPGNGRVYEIFFEASDGRGNSCTGSVKVGVPHDQGKGPAVDDGRRYDSTVAGGPCLNCNQ